LVLSPADFGKFIAQETELFIDLCALASS
jgi:hypothetical protein